MPTPAFVLCCGLVWQWCLIQPSSCATSSIPTHCGWPWYFYCCGHRARLFSGMCHLSAQWTLEALPSTCCLEAHSTQCWKAALCGSTCVCLPRHLSSQVRPLGADSLSVHLSGKRLAGLPLLSVYNFPWATVPWCLGPGCSVSVQGDGEAAVVHLSPLMHSTPTYWASSVCHSISGKHRRKKTIIVCTEMKNCPKFTVEAPAFSGKQSNPYEGTPLCSSLSSSVDSSLSGLGRISHLLFCVQPLVGTSTVASVTPSVYLLLSVNSLKGYCLVLFDLWKYGFGIRETWIWVSKLLVTNLGWGQGWGEWGTNFMFKFKGASTNSVDFFFQKININAKNPRWTKF